MILTELINRPMRWSVSTGNADGDRIAVMVCHAHLPGGVTYSCGWRHVFFGYARVSAWLAGADDPKLETEMAALYEAHHLDRHVETR